MSLILSLFDTSSVGNRIIDTVLWNEIDKITLIDFDLACILFYQLNF